MADAISSRSLITPATTPGSLDENEHKFLVSSPLQSSSASKVSWYNRYPPPYALLTISFIQLIVFSLATKDVRRSFRYDPNNQLEIWRFVTYMFLHNGLFHIIINIFIQCLFAVILEKYQGSVRVGTLYFGGGAAGALGASFTRSDLVEGASAGVYALLISHLSHILLNLESTKYKLWGFVSVTVIVLSDVLYNCIHTRNKGDPVISEGAHVAGAVSGFLLGILLYKSNDKNATKRNKVAFWMALATSLALTCTFLYFNIKINRCNGVNGNQKVQYSYLC